MCTAVLIAWVPLPPSPLDSYSRALLVSKDVNDISLQPPAWNTKSSPRVLMSYIQTLYWCRAWLSVAGCRRECPAPAESRWGSSWASWPPGAAWPPAGSCRWCTPGRRGEQQGTPALAPLPSWKLIRKRFFNPLLFIRGLSCPSSVQASLTQKFS